MKVFVYKDKWDDSLLYSLATVDAAGYKFLGFQEQPDPQPEKKTVVKTIPVTMSDAPLREKKALSDEYYTYVIPAGAKNAKLTYEVEE